MNYSEITDAALAYCDRTKDVHASQMVDTFLRVVESRMRTALTVQKMESHVNIQVSEDWVTYPLPDDYKAIRAVSYTTVIDGAQTTTPLKLMTPEEIEGFTFNQVQITDGYYMHGMNLVLGFQPSAEDAPYSTISLFYYRSVSDLTSSQITNWISQYHPECYIFGLCTEISAFTKDAEAAMLWEQRFNTALTDITNADNVTKWSASSITTRLE